MKKIKLGIVGCGKNFENHIRVYLRNKHVDVEAICDLKYEKAREKAVKYGIKDVYTDYESMLKKDLDLIDIITPAGSHAPLSILALESDKNVLVEKPMALTSKECLAMIDASRRQRKSLCVVHNKLFFETVVCIKKTIESEALNVSRMRLSHYFTHAHPDFLEKWRLDEKQGGILWDALVHHIYMTCDFIGEIGSVYSTARKVKEDVFDSFTLILENEKRVGVCEFVWDNKEPLLELQLLTEEGDRFFADLTHDLILRRSREYENRGISALRSLQDDFRVPFMKWRRHLSNFMKNPSFPGSLPFEKTFFTLINHYISYLIGQKQSLPVLPEEALRSIRILELSRRSIETNQRLQLD